jgi:hypothetical protein
MLVTSFGATKSKLFAFSQSSQVRSDGVLKNPTSIKLKMETRLKYVAWIKLHSENVADHWRCYETSILCHVDIFIGRTKEICHDQELFATEG